MFFLWGVGGKGGCGDFGRLPTLPLWYPAGGRRGFGRLPTLPLACFPAPIPPTPFPSGEGGDLRLFYARGFAPCIPGAERGAALAEPAVQETEGGLRPLHPRGCTHGSPRKRQEAVSYEQCRQPRRGGTGGDGTIRRKRRRRLRWSSPPGLGEQVPHRVQPPLRTPQRQGKQVP